MSVIPLELPVFTSGLACRTRNAEHWRNVDPKTGEEETGKREFSHWEQPNQTFNKMTDQRQKEGPNSSSAHQKTVEYYSVNQPDAQARMLRTEQSMAERRESVSADGLTTRRMTSHSTTVHTSKRVTITGGQNHTPLDHSPQKGKGSLGKQGALNSRRPPSKSALKSSVITLFGEKEDAVSNGNDVSTNGYHRREEIAENREMHTKMTTHEVHASSHSETHQSSAETKRLPHKHSVMVFPPEAMKAVKNALPGDAAWLQEIRQKKTQLRSNRVEQQITTTSEAKPSKPEWMSEAAKKKQRNASIGNLEKSPVREEKSITINNSSLNDEKSSFIHRSTDVKSSETVHRHNIMTNGRSESPKHQSLRKSPSPSTPPPPPPVAQTSKTEHLRDKEIRTKRDALYGSESHRRETVTSARQSRADIFSQQKKETLKVEPGQPRTEIIRVDDKESVVDGHLIRRKTVVTLGSSSSSSVSTTNSSSTFQTKSKSSSPPPTRKEMNSRNSDNAHRSNKDQVVVVVKGPTSSSQKSTHIEASQRNSHYIQKSEVRHHQERSESQVTVNNRDSKVLYSQENYAHEKRKSWPLGVNNTDSLPPPPVWRESEERKSTRNWDELDRGRIYVDPDPSPWVEEVTFSPPAKVQLHKSHHEKRETQTVNVRHFEQSNRHNTAPVNLRPVKDEQRPSSPFQLHPLPPLHSKKTPDWASEAENKRHSKVDWDKLERSGSPKTSKEPPWLNQVRLRHVSSESEVTADQRAAILREIQQFSPRRLRKRVTFAESVNIIARALSDQSDESAREELTPSPVRLEEHFPKEESVRVVVNGRDHQFPKKNETPKHDVAAYIRETVRERRQAAAYRAQENDDEVDLSPTWVEEAEIRQRNDIDWDNLEKKNSPPLSREPSWTLPRQKRSQDSHIIQVRTWKDSGSVQGFERTQSLPSLTSEDDTACFWSRSIDWDSLDQKAWRSTDSFGPWIDEVQLKPTPSQESIEIETFTFPDVHLRRTPSLPRMEPDSFQLPDVHLRRTPSFPRLDPESFELPEVRLRCTPSMSRLEPESFQLPEVTLRRTPSLPKLEPESVQLPEVYLRRTPSLPKLEPDSFQLPEFRLRRTPSQMKMEPESFQLPEVQLRKTPSLPKLQPESFELDYIELRRTPSLPRFEPENFELPNIYLRKSPSFNNFQPESFQLPEVYLNRTPSLSKFKPENFELPEVNLRRTPSLPRFEPESFRLLPVHLRRTPSLPRLEPDSFQVPKVYLRRTPSLPSLPIPSFELPDYRLRPTPITKKRYLRRLLNDDYEYSQREITFHDEDSLESLSSSESPPPWVHVAEDRKHSMVDWDRLEYRPESRSNDCPWSDVNLRRTEMEAEYEARQSKMSFSDEEEQTYWARTGSLPRPKPNEEARLARWTSSSPPTKAVSVESIATTDEDRLQQRSFDTLSRSFLKSRGPSWERLVEQNKNTAIRLRETSTSRPRDVTSRPPWIRELKLRATPGVPTLDANQSETPKLSMPEPSKPTPRPPSPPRQPDRVSGIKTTPKPKSTDIYYGRPNIEASVLKSVQLKKASHLTKVRGPQVGKVLDEKKEPLKRSTSPEARVSVSPVYSTRDSTTQDYNISVGQRNHFSKSVSSSKTDNILGNITLEKEDNIRSTSPIQSNFKRERTETKINGGYTSPFRAKSESEEEQQGYQYSVTSNTTSRFMSQASPIRKYEKSISVPKRSSYLSISKTNQENKTPVRKGSQDISVDEVLRSIRLIREASQSSPNLFANKKESFADSATRTVTVQQNSYKTMVTTSYNYQNEALNRSTRLSSPTEEFSKPQRRLTSPITDSTNKKAEPLRADTPDWLLELKKKKTRLSTALVTATNRGQTSTEKLDEKPRKYSAPERTTPDRITPDRITAGRTTPDRITTGRTTPDRITTGRTTPDRITTGRTTPDRITTGRTTPDRITTGRTTPDRITTGRTTPDKAERSSSPAERRSVSPTSSLNLIGRPRTSPPPPPTLTSDFKTPKVPLPLKKDSKNDFNSVIAQIKTINRDDLLVDMKTSQKCGSLRRRLFHDKKESKSTQDKKQMAGKQNTSPSGKESTKDTSSSKGSPTRGSGVGRSCSDRHAKTITVNVDEKGRKPLNKQTSPPRKERKKPVAPSENISSTQRRQASKPVTPKPAGRTSPGRTSPISTTKQAPAAKRNISPEKQSESPKITKSSSILNSSSSQAESENFVNSFSSVSLSSFSTSTSTQNSTPKWQEYSTSSEKSFKTWRPPTPPSPRRFWEREDSPTRSPSPPVRQSPSPTLRRSPSPPLRSSPSPPLRRSPSPPLRRSPSPPLRYTPSPDASDDKPRRFSQLLANLTSKKDHSLNETENTCLKTETMQFMSSKTSESSSRLPPRILSETRKTSDTSFNSSPSVSRGSPSPSGDREKHVRFSSEETSEALKSANSWNNGMKKENSTRTKSVKFRDEPETIGTSAYVITGEMEIEKKITTSTRTVTKSVSQFS